MAFLIDFKSNNYFCILFFPQICTPISFNIKIVQLLIEIKVLLTLEFFRSLL